MSAALRQHVLDALMRRAEQQPAGRLRELLLARHEHLAQREWSACRAVPAPAEARPGPLAALLADLRPAQALPEPRAMQTQRREWNAMRLERRLAEPLKPVAPAGQIGPLNTQALVPRALQQLHGLSSDYLQRLLVQVDTLAQLAPLALLPAKPRSRSR